MTSLCMSLNTGTGISFLVYLCSFPYPASQNEAQIHTQVQYCNVKDNKKVPAVLHIFLNDKYFLDTIKLHEQEVNLQGNSLGK